MIYYFFLTQDGKVISVVNSAIGDQVGGTFLTQVDAGLPSATFIREILEEALQNANSTYIRKYEVLLELYNNLYKELEEKNSIPINSLPDRNLN